MRTAFTRRDLVLAISSAIDIRQIDAGVAVDAVFYEISKALAEGRRCKFHGFGTFSAVEHRSRIGRNPRKPDVTYSVPGHKVVKFHPSAGLRRAVAGAGAPGAAEAPEED